MSRLPKPGFETLAVHAGAFPDPVTGACITPIYQTASFVLDGADEAASLFALESPGYKYSRIANPTLTILEERVAALEGGTAAVVSSSGHAAQVLALFPLMQSGDEFIAANRLYGGSVAQFGTAFSQFGWNVRWAEADRPESFAAAITSKTKAIFIESIANPAGAITDIKAISDIARQYNIPLIVDNTLASPYLIRPFEYGADIIVHSATKFLGGHGNSLAGIVVDGGRFKWAGDERYPLLSRTSEIYPNIVFAEKFSNYAYASAVKTFGLQYLGSCLSPFNAFLILNGIETLPLRMQRQCDNALAVASFLQDHPSVQWVSYAGLEQDIHYQLACRYTPKGAGAVFSFGLKGGYDAAIRLISRVKLFTHLANIGDTRSLIIHPASTTHKQLTAEQKKESGICDAMVRLSIGIENQDDLIFDIETALQ